VRADDLCALTAAGWAALRDHGVRTVVNLRNDDEVEAAVDAAPRPAGIEFVRVPMDDAADTAFWEHVWREELDGSPLYYRLFLERKAERCAEAVAAVARAEGGVVFHCGGGRDRTGIVALLLLALADVEPEEIVADYERSNVRLRRAWAARGEPDQGVEIDEILARKGTTARALLLELLGSLDAEEYLRLAGLGERDLAAARARLR
jgi:protein-tyrosine phosphatase